MLTVSDSNFFKLSNAALAKFAVVCFGISLCGCTTWKLTEKSKDPSAPEAVDHKLFQIERFLSLIHI